MFEDKEFRFITNVSREEYKLKTDATACLSRAGSKAIGMDKMAFREVTVSLQEFLKLATSGHAFCNLFQYDENEKYWVETKKGKKYCDYPVYRRGANKGCMKIQIKADKFFRGTHTVFVDVDDTRFVDVQEYLGCLKLFPTLVYMSFSDKQPKGKEKKVSRRFRMVYVFNDLLDAQSFRHISRVITMLIERDTGEPMEDKCGTNMSQYMNGCWGNEETYCSDTIYELADFTEGGGFFVPPPEDDIELTDDEVNEIAVFDEQMLNDMERLDYDQFMHYYSRRLPYIYRTERADWELGLYQFTDDSYLQLYYYLEPVMDGNRRRRKMFWATCLRRLMVPGIDPNILLFNLYIDRQRFYDNSDGVLTITCLKRRVIKAMSLTEDELIQICQPTIDYWREHRPTLIFKNGVGRGRAKEVYKLIRYKEIDKIYDRSISLRENMERGIGVPQATLYRFCKEYGIDTYPVHKKSSRELKRDAKQEKIKTFCSLYDPTLSGEKNSQRMAENGLDISGPTIRKWAAKYYDGGSAPVPTPVRQDSFMPLPEFNFNFNFGNSTLQELDREEENFAKHNWIPPTNNQWWQPSFLF